MEVISLTGCSIKASDSRVLDKEQAEEIETTDTSINNTIISIEQTEEIEPTNNSISIKQTEEMETTDTSISTEQTEEIEPTNTSINIEQTEEMETTDTLENLEQSENKEENTTENEYKPNEWEAQLENTNINEIVIGGEKIEIKKEIIDIKENIDNIFGKGTSNIFMGDGHDLDLLMPLLDDVMPKFKNQRKEQVNKYLDSQNAVL